MSLPALLPLSPVDALLDSLTATRDTLVRHLGHRAAMRVALAFAARTLRDPLRHLPPAGWPDAMESRTRRALRFVFTLDDALCNDPDISEGTRMAVLSEIVAEAGSRAMARQIPTIAEGSWANASDDERADFGRGLAASAYNARMELVGATPQSLAVDVTACRFVELCHAAGRAYLAPFFCEADVRLFKRSESLVELRRTGTIALGAPRCDFRFHFHGRDGE